MTTTQKAVNHFLTTYAEEIKAGVDISGDCIYEWWGQSNWEYQGVDYDEVEKLIFKAINA